MRLLLDENIDRKLARFFGDEHDILTVKQRGWVGLENGDLIEAAQEEFDALATMDRGIPHQQNLRAVNLIVLVLEAPSNRLADLTPLIEPAKAALLSASLG